MQRGPTGLHDGIDGIHPRNGVTTNAIDHIALHIDMRAAQFYAAGDIRVEDIEEPKASDGKIIVDVEWCGICGSELHEYLMGPMFMPKETIPFALGHELCGRVKDPPPGSRLKDGEAVMIDPRILCQSCIACKVGSTACCQKLGYIGGTTGDQSPSSMLSFLSQAPDDLWTDFRSLALRHLLIVRPLSRWRVWGACSSRREHASSTWSGHPD